MVRIWTSLFCNMCYSAFDKEQPRVQLQLLGANFNVVTADGAMNIFHGKEYFMSLNQGQSCYCRTSPVHFRHPYNECYVDEIVQSATTSQKLFAHDDASA